MKPALFTVGYAAHSLASFIELLQRHGVTAIADVRSSPYSRQSPDFCQRPLKEALSECGIAYAFLGEELGARRTEPECYLGNRVSYAAVRELPAFSRGIERLNKGLNSYRIALLCAEKDPITCHRTILICREFRRSQITIRHILSDGELEEHTDAEMRLLQTIGMSREDLFDDIDKLVDHAYEVQAERIAYVAATITSELNRDNDGYH